MIELLVFGLSPELKPSPLIQTITETQTVQVEPPPQEPTLEEKIATNYYNCDESRQYIRADNANCLDRPQIRASETRKDESHDTTQLSEEKTSSAPSGWYDKGQCTHYVSTRRQVGKWGNASSWVRQAKAEGYTISSTPVAGAIGQLGNHVVYVESVNGDTITISEANYDYRGSIRTITVPSNKYTYIY